MLHVNALLQPITLNRSADQVYIQSLTAVVDSLTQWLGYWTCTGMIQPS